MTTTTEVKPNKDATISNINVFQTQEYLNAKEETIRKFLQEEKRHNAKKSELVKEYAKRLSEIKGIDLHSISKVVGDDLKAFVSNSHVRNILGSEYKNKAQSDRAKSKGKSGRDSSAKQAQSGATTSANQAQSGATTSAKSVQTKLLCSNCEQEIRELQYGAYQIKPENCRIEDLDKYSRELLIEYVKRLDAELKKFSSSKPKNEISLRSGEEYDIKQVKKYDRDSLIRIIEWHDAMDDAQMENARQWDDRRKELVAKVKELQTENEKLHAVINKTGGGN